MIQEMRFIVGLTVTVLVLSIPVAEVTRRYLVVKKFKSMFPEKEIRFAPPLYDIDFRQVPMTKKGQQFIGWYEWITRANAAVCVFIFVLAILIGQLYY